MIGRVEKPFDASIQRFAAKNLVKIINSIFISLVLCYSSNPKLAEIFR